jgi:hypothetical protein
MFKSITHRVRNARVAATRGWRDTTEDLTETHRWLRTAVICLALYLLVVAILAFFWNREPEVFPVAENAAELLSGVPASPVTGSTTTITLITLAETLLDKPGGFISNDKTPPGVWMDNMPSWEYGVLIQIRDMSKAMREAFSRSQSQSSEDESLALAESRFNFNSNSWLLPRTEDEYRDGTNFLYDYLWRLTDENNYDAQFYARADNLRYWLSTVETRLGNLSQRLSASVGQRRLNTDLAGDPGARQATATPSERHVKTPWLEIDDVFYEARGSTWALLHLLKAIETDFADVLAQKNARVSLQQIIRELEASQQPMMSPMVLNGSGFGFLANHSLVMASYISRANAGIIDLRELLDKG